MSDTRGPWGPYRATIEDHVDTCTDYLGRLRRSLAGEIAPDRHHFGGEEAQDVLDLGAHRRPDPLLFASAGNGFAVWISQQEPDLGAFPSLTAGGVLADVFGLRAPFVVGGAGMIVLAVVMAPIVNTRTIREAQQR